MPGNSFGGRGSPLPPTLRLTGARRQQQAHLYKQLFGGWDLQLLAEGEARAELREPYSHGSTINQPAWIALATGKGGETALVALNADTDTWLEQRS